VRTRDYLPLALLGGIAAFIVVQGSEMGRTRKARRAAEPPALTAQGEVQPQGDATASKAPADASRAIDISPPAELRASDEPPPPLRDDAVVRDAIRSNSAGTYIQPILNDQEQWLMRWPDRRREALRVWIERDVNMPDWSTTYPVVAEKGFEEWKEAGFPLRFDVVTSKVGSDIQISWVEKFPPSDGHRIGVTIKYRDQHGWLVTSEIRIATHDAEGRALPPETIAGVARHEIGHALGLGHSTSPTDVMLPESRTSVISDIDRATLHLIYTLPPGVVK
jgi:hypothetical protein